jgi:agmatine deiminase
MGYAMPAEWERHDGTWLAWPYDPVTFPNRVKKVESAYVKMILALSKNEIVNLFVTDLKMKEKVRKILKQKGVDLHKIKFHVWNYVDVWFRDYGPVFVLNKEKKQVAFVRWIFNAWGEKYKELMRDTQIPDVISDRLQFNNFRPGIVLEGGSVDVNGKGTILTTEQCLLNKNRNPHLSKIDIEKYLMNYFGAGNIIWLKGGIIGDDTDGHIDNLARFVNPKTVLCAFEEDESDDNHGILKQNYEIHANSTDQYGKKLKVIKMLMPPVIRSKVRGEKIRLPASYLNFYVANKIVLVPTYGHKNDKLAQKIIAKQFPGRKVVGIDCRDLIYGMGAIHCVVQQQPMI